MGAIVVCKSKGIIREIAQSSNTSNQNVVVGCVQRRNIGLGNKNCQTGGVPCFEGQSNPVLGWAKYGLNME